MHSPHKLLPSCFEHKQIPFSYVRGRFVCSLSTGSLVPRPRPVFCRFVCTRGEPGNKDPLGARLVLTLVLSTTTQGTAAAVLFLCVYIFNTTPAFLHKHTPYLVTTHKVLSVQSIMLGTMRIINIAPTQKFNQHEFFCFSKLYNTKMYTILNYKLYFHLYPFRNCGISMPTIN